MSIAARPSSRAPRHAVALSLAALALGAAAWALVPHAGRQATVAWLDDLCSSVTRPMFASAPAPEGSAARPQTTLRPLSCEPLPNVPGKSITTAMVEFPPLAYTPAHRHPGSVQAVVVSGTVRSQMAGGPAVDYQAGQTWFEPPRALHLFAENPDPVKPASLIATFIADSDCGPLVLPP